MTGGVGLCHLSAADLAAPQLGGRTRGVALLLHRTHCNRAVGQTCQTTARDSEALTVCVVHFRVLKKEQQIQLT
jgi:hypothetical protein